MASAAGAATSQRGGVGAVKDVAQGSGPAPLLLCGRKEPLGRVMWRWAAGRAGGAAVRGGRLVRGRCDAGLSEAAVVVSGGEVVVGLDTQTRSTSRVIGRATDPCWRCWSARPAQPGGEEAGRVSGCDAADLMRTGGGGSRVRRWPGAAEKAGPKGVTWRHSAALRVVVERMTEGGAASEDGADHLVPGADMPILTALQMGWSLGSVLLREKVRTDGRWSLLSVLGRVRLPWRR